MAKEHHLCYCELQEEKDGPWIVGLAFLSAPGVSDILKFVPSDGAGAMRTLKCWDYCLLPHIFAATVTYNED